MHGGGEQQRRDRRQVGVGVAVGQHDERRADRDRRRHLGADLLQPRRHRDTAAAYRVEPADPRGLEAGQVAVVVDVQDLGQLVVVDHRERQHDLAARGRRADEQVLLRPDQRAERGDELLADRVERRVGDLGEQLGEVVEEQPRPVGEHGDRGVGAHRADRLGAGAGHRRDQDPQLLLGVAEGLLAAYDRLVGVTTCSRSGRSSRCSSPACSQSSYGCAAASAALTSSSSTIRPRRCRRGTSGPAAAGPCARRSPGRCRARRPRWPGRPGRRRSPRTGRGAGRCGRARRR